MIRLLFILCFFLGASLHSEESKYQLGQGLQVGELPLYIGGYFSGEYEHITGEERSLTLNELAIMAYGEYNNFSYLLEFEAEDLYNEVFGDEALEVEHKDFHIERLYINYEFNENYALMLGKNNSPIGFWNRIPINVLRDTTSNPAITKRLFPRFTSGADILYQSQNEYALSINSMIQVSEDLDKIINNNVFNNFDVDSHYGMGLSLQDDAWTYQFNAGYFHVTSGKDYYYLLGAFKYELSDFRLQAEVGTQFNEDGSTMPYAGYLQGLYTIEEHHEVILRLESYHEQKFIDQKDSFAVMGYTYRPLYPVAVKTEFQWHSIKQENKLLLSVSVLF